jgi:hypothetical protein
MESTIGKMKAGIEVSAGVRRRRAHQESEQLALEFTMPCRNRPESEPLRVAAGRAERRDLAVCRSGVNPART